MSFNPKLMLQQVKANAVFSENDIMELVFRVDSLFAMESNVISIPSPCNVCGDVHGQFQDVMQLLDLGDSLNSMNYLFMGDYVDRGLFSVQTIVILYIRKLLNPEHFFLLRGNHESRGVSSQYGFYEQVMKNYQHSGVWKAFTESFDFMPIAAIVDNRIFCVHGGISPTCPTLDSVRLINRSVEVPMQGPLADLLWSDPEPRVANFVPSGRGAGCFYGKGAVEQFHQINGTQIIARSHQLAVQGYQWYFNKQCITVWSCPNYTYRCKNPGCIMQVKNGKQEFHLFEASKATLEICSQVQQGK